MTKKAIPLMVVFCMLLSFVFTGCGDVKTSSKTASGSNPTPDTSSSEISSDVSSGVSSGVSSDVSSDVSSSEDISSNATSTTSSNQSQATQTPTPGTKPKPNTGTGTDTQTPPTPTNSAAQQLKIYTHNVCSHGDEGSGSANRLPALNKVITENAPNIVVLVECNALWAKSVAKACGYERADNARTGLSEIQILYKADEFNLIENKVDDSTRGAYHWAILESKKTSKRFIVYGYHGTVKGLDAQPARYTEVKAMMALVAEKNLPAVLTGDFNTRRGSDEYNLTESLCENPAITAELKYDGLTHLGWTGNAGSTIDHTLYTKGNFIAKKFTVLDQDYEGLILSDHCALLATLEMK